jgi:hypothetical protein
MLGKNNETPRWYSWLTFNSVVVLFAVNVIFTQRILRAVHPKFGWSPLMSNVFLAILISVPVIIVNNIVWIVILFFTQNIKVIDVARGFLILGAVWTMLLSVFPILVVGVVGAIPSPTPVEKFGTGRFRFKIILLVFASAILFTGAITRLVSDLQDRPASNPGEVNSTATFYTTGFMLEIIVVITYAVGRIDLRFWIPDGSSGPGDYSKKETDQEELFQDVEVKMRMSIGSSNWEDNGGEKMPVTREEVQQRVESAGLMGRPVDIGDSEILLYAFRVEKSEGGAVQMPQRPPRSSTWYRASRSEEPSVI